MIIKKINLYAIRLPLKQPFIISYHTYEDMPSIILEMETDEGIIGYGEAVADEHVTGETWESTFQVLQHTLAPKMIGENPFHIEKIHELMDQAIYNAPTAKAAIDIACYDLIGKKVNQPVYQLLGGRYHDEFQITHVLSITDPDTMADEAAGMIEKGFQSFKMKVGTDVDQDIERIRKVRERVGWDVPIRVDVNQGWKNSSQTLKALRHLQDLNIDWLEQPVLADDVDGMVRIKSKTDIPLMIDEGLKGVRDMCEIIGKQAADKVNIKLMKSGGIYPSVKLAHMAEMAGMECQVGSMVESSIASAAGFHMAFSKKVITSVELTGPIKFSKDIGDLHYDVPFIRLSDKAGLGVTVDKAILEELTEFKSIVE
ncbi:mandelate racemase/muconate lactonizing enzyme family protein [Rossellomorea vietnamensis]|uniref:mandelate racemase/muconate lactonizing enzyme family protein n=1 Tax=Rossellomorea vietnamensis TaxID=218284 RepID=UPI001E49F821|nr:dipeptide epimerase [Rossellomorea vietnamensis]MCC5801760.1 dipeptide epimerase [Rossellomorea vietnamensis]